MSAPRKQSVCIFAGAGLSIPLGIPGMPGFMFRVRDAGFGDDESWTDFDKVVDERTPMAEMIGDPISNLESLATCIATLHENFPDREFAGCTRIKHPSDALVFIKQAIHFACRRRIESGHVATLGQLIYNASRYCDISIVTTNYDVNIELGSLNYINNLHGARKYLCDPGPEIIHHCIEADAPQRPKSIYFLDEHDRDTTRIPTYKLHGSVNWLLDEGTVRVAHQAISNPKDCRPLSQPHNSYGYIANSWLLPIDATSETHDEDFRHEWLMVAPVATKPVASSLLASQWKLAADALREADQVWFIGYSFPQTDSGIRYFISSALANNSKLRQIAIINPDLTVADYAESDLFTSRRMSDIVRVYPCNWDAMSPNQILQMDDSFLAHDERQVQQLELAIRRESALRGRIAGQPTSSGIELGMRSRSRNFRGR